MFMAIKESPAQAGKEASVKGPFRIQMAVDVVWVRQKVYISEELRCNNKMQINPAFTGVNAVSRSITGTATNELDDDFTLPVTFFPHIS